MVCLMRRPSPYRTRPGAHFSEILMFLCMTGILAMFSMRKLLDEDGPEMVSKFEFTTGIDHKVRIGFA